MGYNRIKAVGLGAGLLALSACNSVPQELLKYKTTQPFITLENRELASSLAKKYPDDPFYTNQSEVLVEFYLEDKKGSRKSKREDQEDEKMDDMVTELKAKVTYYQSVLALNDFTDYRDQVYYNDLMTVSPIYYSYEAFREKHKWYYKTTFSSSYEVDGMFYTDARLKYFSAKIPAQGTQLDYVYSVVYDNVTYLTNLYFLDYMPMGKKSVTFKIPDWLDAEIIEKNLSGFNISRSTRNPRGSKIETFREQMGWDADSESDTKSKKRGQKRTKYNYIHFEASNMQPLKREKYATGPTHQMPHVLVSLKKYEDKSGKEKNILGSVSDLYAWYHKLVSNVENDTSKVAEKARELTQGKTSDLEKVKAVYYWIQDNVRYIAYEDGIAGFQPEACQNVFEDRYGDCKGMANLLTQMLRCLGYDAHVTWIGTRRIAYDYSIPSLAVDNHMICTLNLDGKRYFLDPTEDYIELGDYAHRIQGRQVLIENGDTFLLDRVPNLGYERNQCEKTESFTLSDDGDLIGQAKEVYRGESKTNILRFYNELKSDRRATALERYLNDQNTSLQVNNIHFSDLTDRVQPVTFDYDLRVKNHALKADNKLFLKLDWVGE
ncbi:MAG: hypothetical protein GC180_02125 [Bacteroidetes bacterium]|nr:hypothetical protein [Bacteroidota bacterium]